MKRIAAHYLKWLWIAIMSGVVIAQAQTSTPLPRDQNGRLILPGPTPEQRERGRQLLNKTLHVVQTIPLTESETILSELGYINTESRMDSNRLIFTPIEKNFRPNPDGLGFEWLGVSRSNLVPISLEQKPSSLSGGFDTKFYCVHIDDTIERLKHLAQNVKFEELVRTHGSLYSVKQRIDSVVFERIAHAQGQIRFISLIYDHQYCAFSINIQYTPFASGDKS